VAVTINTIEGISKDRLIINNTVPNNFLFCLNNLKTNITRIIPAKNNKSVGIRIKAEFIFRSVSYTTLFSLYKFVKYYIEKR